MGIDLKKFRLTFLASLLACCLLVQPARELHAEEKKPLVVGVLPYLSPITLLKRFEPLAEHLREELGQKVTLTTEPNFPRFKNETEMGKYDIVLTAPHFVPPALDSGHYQLQTTTVKPLSAVLITRSDSPITNIAEFKNPVVATPPEKALISIIGKQYFPGENLQPSHYVAYNSHNAAYHAVLRNNADAAIISINVYNRAILDKKPLRIISQSNDYPGVGFLTAKTLSQKMQDKIHSALLSLDETLVGKDFLQRTTYKGFRPASPALYAPFRKLLGN